jgi:hypothetical protein
VAGIALMNTPAAIAGVFLTGASIVLLLEGNYIDYANVNILDVDTLDLTEKLGLMLDAIEELGKELALNVDDLNNFIDAIKKTDIAQIHELMEKLIEQIEERKQATKKENDITEQIERDQKQHNEETQGQNAADEKEQGAQQVPRSTNGETVTDTEQTDSSNPVAAEIYRRMESLKQLVKEIEENLRQIEEHLPRYSHSETVNPRIIGIKKTIEDTKEYIEDLTLQAQKGEVDGIDLLSFDLYYNSLIGDLEYLEDIKGTYAEKEFSMVENYPLGKKSTLEEDLETAQEILERGEALLNKLKNMDLQSLKKDESRLAEEIGILKEDVINIKRKMAAEELSNLQRDHFKLEVDMMVLTTIIAALEKVLTTIEEHTNKIIKRKEKKRTKTVDLKLIKIKYDDGDEPEL